MKMLLFNLVFICTTFNAVFGKFDPNWDSLDNRILPDWFDKAKVGIFLHWGVYSVPGFASEFFWKYWKDGSHGVKEFMTKNYPPNFTYQDFAPEFTAEFFDPDEWADLFVQSGAKYVVLTSKHHEGYTLWPSKYSYSWNAKDVGPHRDLVGDFAAAIKKTNLHFGLYHSLYEWYNPMYVSDKANKWNTTVFVDSKVIPEMKDLITTYKPDILWSDGQWEAPDTYWKSTEFLAWLYNDSPVKDVVVTNDRWGDDTKCKHGGFITCGDRYNPGELLPSYKWEKCMTVDKNSWGYRRNANINDILTIDELIKQLVETVSRGGNILINVGPTKEGTIIPIFQERLRQLGTWLSINGEAIYESTPWAKGLQKDNVTSDVWYTAKDPVVYAIVLSWPKTNTLSLGSANTLFGNENTVVTLLGNDLKLSWSVNGDHVDITFPDKTTVTSEWAWVLKISPASSA